MTAADRREEDLVASPGWYHDAVVYELHVRAFYDTNGDGIGDFRGLIQKLDYLRDLGVTALWLLPFYPSPLRDDGYDISDYRAINPAYGNMRDFRRFLREAHARDLKVITELVINHTSDQHPWFQRARRAAPGTKERDFYVWSDTPDRYRDARIIFQDTETSNWAWDPVAHAYYWHRFFAHQPDLNYENPAVHEAVLSTLDYWLEMGVDGLRLDAVPYLYERDGTMCENLPETHAFLKKLRAHIDSRYQDRMLLAEANQWPEDSASYFGDGDECHMAFHFPLMPRLFMSLRMENRFPVIDILEQTPEIPETATWAIFLRNHDELTLEMVTDEERDYMYRVYAHDQEARINLGIRRRLAPLLGNNRREMELMNALLFSLPGTPFIYYGDELGMGDNVYLGDRNGVRTPMQWSGDRNAGFSTANPQRLYLPVTTDPEYHFETVNVAVQRSNPNSLWWWMKRMISLRKALPELSRGRLEFLQTENPKVLSFLRSDHDRSVLVVANLSRHTQPVEIELPDYEGVEPVEVFGRTRFPPIVGSLFLTLGPHDFYWFSLDRKLETELPEASDRPTIRVRGEADTVFRARTQLERALASDLVSRRWFRSKAQTLREARLVDLVAVPGSEARIAYLQVDYVEADPETYVIPLAVASGPDAARLLLETPGVVIAEIEGARATAVLYDGVMDRDFAAALVGLAAGRKRIKGREVQLRPESVPGRRKLSSEIEGLPVRATGVEQSNSSVIIGDQLILKLFRKLEVGPNPDVEVGRFLSERARFAHTARARGVVNTVVGAESAALGFVQEYVPNQGDAWAHALDVAVRFFEEVAARPEEMAIPPDPAHPLDMVDDLPERAVTLLGPILSEAELLGERTAEMHLALASRPSHPIFAPEPLSTLYQRSVYQTMRSSLRTSLGLLRRRRPHLSPADAELAEDVLASEGDLLERLKLVTGERMDTTRIRIHGDYHLGQVLFTGNDYVVIDFEGEPLRPLTERRLKRLALRDVASMIRSYHYASLVGLQTAVDTGIADPQFDAHLDSWSGALYRWTTASFLKGYLSQVGDSNVVPAEQRHIRWLLDAFLVAKAAYELEYELNNRPEWVGIPLRGILAAVEEERAAPSR